MMCQRNSTDTAAPATATKATKETCNNIDDKSTIKPNLKLVQHNQFKQSSPPQQESNLKLTDDHHELKLEQPNMYYNNGINKSLVKHEPMDSIEPTTSHISNAPNPLGDDSVINNLEQQEPNNSLVEYDFKPYGQEDSCDFNPEFASICSFIAKFGDKINLELNIQQLKSIIEDQSELNETLIDLHVKLLKKTRRYFVRDQWEKALIRFAAEYSYEDAYEIESLGYQKTRPSIKLLLLRKLLEAQFECDQKFKAAVNLLEANDLRILPIGRDIRGNTYWQRTDSEGNLRIFQEQPLDYKSWKTVCSDINELDQLLNDLEASKDDKVKGDPILEPYNPLPQIFPEYFKIEEKVEEDALPEGENQGKEESPVKRKANNKSKKGRGRARGKNKSSLLAVVNEVNGEEDEEDSNIEVVYANKLESKIQIKDEHQTTQNGLKTQPKPPAFHDKESVESQVKNTIENLMNRVVSSFEYLIRPLSRNSTENAPKVETTIVEEPKPRKKTVNRRDKQQNEEELPRRSSSRIQQLQLKKIAEEEEKMKKMIESKKSSFNAAIIDEDSRSRSVSSRNNRKRSESPEEECKNGKRKRKGGKSWRRGKGKKKLSWDKDDSDLSSTSPLTESDDEDDFDFADDTLKFGAENYDDEFACEEEETNMEPVIVKRARTARQSNALADQGDLNTSSIVEEDKPCGRCDKSNDPEWILLCDICDDGYHTSCCLPPLMIVPDGDWFCPPCEHKTLLTKLKELYTSTKEILDIKERERVKRQRLRQNVKKEQVKIETQENLPEKRSRDFMNELSEPLAVQALDEILEPPSDGETYNYNNERHRNRTKKRSQCKKTTKSKPKQEGSDDFKLDLKRPRKTYSRRTVSDSDEEEDQFEDETEEEGVPEESSSSDDEVRPKQRRARASVSYRFQEYDELIKSAIQGDSYEEEMSERASTPEKCNYGRGKDMATIEALAYQQENGLINQSTGGVAAVEDANVVKTKQKSRKKSRRLNDLDANSETEGATSDESFQASSATEAEDEDEDLTEAESLDETDTSIDELIAVKHSKLSKKSKKKKRRSSYESDDSDYQPRTRRAAASKRVSYKESTEEDTDFAQETPKKTKREVLSSDDESQASWKSPALSIDDDRPTSCDESEEEKAEEELGDKKDQEGKQQAKVQDEFAEPSESLDSGGKNLIDLDTLRPVKKRIDMNSSINDSIDEIAAPLYAPRMVHVVPSQSQPSTHPITQQPIQPPVHQPHILPQQQLQSTTPPSIPERSTPTKVVNSTRDPIQELNQYCSESANSASMFNSFNQILLKNPAAPIHHPPFYEEKDLKPSNQPVRRQ